MSRGVPEWAVLVLAVTVPALRDLVEGLKGGCGTGMVSGGKEGGRGNQWVPNKCGGLLGGRGTVWVTSRTVKLWPRGAGATCPLVCESNRSRSG